MSDSGMKIVVAGTLNKDLILPFQGTSIQSFGGIYFTTSALSHMQDPDLTIIPVSYIGNDVYNNVLAMLKQSSNVQLLGLIPIDQKNHEVILEYVSPEERQEKALFNFPPLEWSHLKKHKKADFYIINMITGWDLTLHAFLKLSKKYYHQMYLDVHFLVMGIDQLGKRFPLCPENILQWLKGARFIQLNEREFATLNRNKLHEITFFEENCKPDQVLIITLAGKGARVIFRKNGMVRDKLFPAYPVEKVIDSTGCGDVFGAGFVYQYIKSQDLYRSIDFANQLASANCLLKGTNEMELLLSQMNQLSRTPVQK